LFSWPDGRYYNGCYLNDEKDGLGEFRWANGERYIGNWCKNKQHGAGIMISPKGSETKCEWKEGELQD